MKTKNKLNIQYSLIVIGLIISIAIGFFIFWKTQLRFNIHFFTTWLILLIASYPTLIGIRFSLEFENENLGGLIQFFIPKVFFLLIIIIVFISSGVIQYNNRYEYVEQLVEVIEDEDALLNLITDKNDIHIVDSKETIARIKKEISKLNELGKEYKIDDYKNRNILNTQIINGKIKYVIAILPNSIVKKDNLNYGYFTMDRIDGSIEFIDDSLLTTTGSSFSSATGRIINNYLDSIGVSGQATLAWPEVDECGVFNYCAAVYTKKGISGMPIVKGIVELNAKTLKCNFYNLNNVPKYIDKVIPEFVFREYLDYYVKYKDGPNWFAVSNIAGIGTICINNTCYYYSCISPTGISKQSNGIMLMNCRTGKMKYFKTNGNNESIAKDIAEKIFKKETGYVKEKEDLEEYLLPKETVASFPTLININGVETYLISMFDEETNSIAGYVLISYKDLEISAFSKNINDAKNEYVKKLLKNNVCVKLTDSNLKTAEGVISEIKNENKNGNTTYYIKINGKDTIYQIGSDLNEDIVFAKVGDDVKIKYYNTDSHIENAIQLKF